ncbi:hypothetical protein ABEB36_013517 [Hypothenemus hampei]|uniref:Sushi, von Willebrand factor type A, EGF and pentraxin domain-containing protein 1 n=1 Tax=Hypothenemus hampei TaxID=57062 RepID=A0ABD1E4E9_HYPHA
MDNFRNSGKSKNVVYFGSKIFLIKHTNLGHPVYSLKNVHTGCFKILFFVKCVLCFLKNIDDISSPLKEHNKCLLLNEQLMNIEYKGGETYTLGAFQKAKEIFDSSTRNDSKKVIFLITDGYSNGEDPIPLSNQLKNDQVTIFTIGIRNGNYKELYELSSIPGEFYSYLLDSFEEFEGLARRALHVDLSAGDYLPLGLNTPCDKLCEEGDCCDEHALCTCSTTSGHYSCTCQPGYYGSGLKNNCLPCTPGTYSDGPNLCLPCPDVHHTTIPPAYGIDSCDCKKGFQSNGKNGCQILKCPKIQAPNFGYIVKKKECSNVLNSACGVRCEVGYTLVGSSIRLCQDNATWSGSDPTCEVKTCAKLSVPKHGSIKCEQTDLKVVYNKNEKNLPVDAICSFKCQKGTFLIGSAQRTCLPITQWDGLRTLCKPIKCNSLLPIKHGRLEPPSCNSGKQEYGKVCNIICDEGFEPTGPTNKTCGDGGIWNKKHQEPTLCIDETPPNLKCPENITSTTLPGTNYGQVSWNEPHVTDNSGLEVSLWIKPGIINITEYKFVIGLTPITYFAQDVFNNAITCKFYVEILDKEPPSIEDCISPVPFLIPKITEEIKVSWDEPNIFDNSQNVFVTKSHEFGSLKIGTTLVTYTAKDPSGNINVCNLNITLEESQCPDLIPPLNSHSECQNQSNGIQCVITCQEGYAIPLQISSEFENSISIVCNHEEAMWYTQDGMLFPECSVSVVADKSQEGKVEIPSDDNACPDGKITNKIRDEIKDSIVNSICNGTCEIDVKSECELEKLEENSNILLKTSRRKRSTNVHKGRAIKNRLNIKFQMRGKSFKGPSLIKIAGLNGTITINSSKFDCPLGFTHRKNRCVQCPKGTFHNITKDICQSCDFGYFNDKLGQTNCIQCPPNYSTRKMHIKSFKECKAMCPPGTHASKKKIKLSRQNDQIIERASLTPHCKSCLIGTYQSNYGQIACLPCPMNYTTAKLRSNSTRECIPTAEVLCNLQDNKCGHGKCNVINQYEFSCECFSNYFGARCDKQVSFCDSQPCFNEGECKSFSDKFFCTCPAGYSGQLCEIPLESENKCNLTCLNGGTCLDIDDNNEFICACSPGFLGNLCELKTKICNNVICENNSTCIEQGASFRCICSNGFLGRRCNIVPCDYKPCPESKICLNLNVENATENDFRCVCPEGRTGPNCLNKIDYCENIYCKNGAECVTEDFTFKCKCSKLYNGRLCEFRKDTRYMLNFSRYDINDYLKLKGFEENLTEITACLWMQTLDNFNYGTLLSYATRHMDNAFTLTDYTGLVLYVNNHYVVTDVLLNDGYWHHICATWGSALGTYQIFVDSKLITNGIDLSPHTTIEGHGFLIVGQEQDTLGGRFSQSESFIGSMAYIDLWPRILSSEEVFEHQNDCSDSIIGDLYGWPEMQENTNGNVKRLSSMFCGNCEDPKPLYNGFIEMVDNKAYYSCYEGFELSNPQYLNGRKCTKTAQWEGFYEPFCKKINCGYPGSIRNGYTIGNQYFYNDKIIYGCYEDFTLVGNSVIVCKQDGQWYPKKPICTEIQCDLPVIPNGIIKIITEVLEDPYLVGKIEVDAQVQIYCSDNTIVLDESIITCLKDGTWDKVLPKCKSKKTLEPILKCPLNLIPNAPLNGYLDEYSLQAVANGTADFVEYKCQTGYELIGNNVSTCILDGYWSDPKFSCQGNVSSSP